METFEFKFGPWSKQSQLSNKKPIIVGVVGSGNLEVLVEEVDLNGGTKFYLETSIDGFEKTWQAVLADFAEQERFANTIITINDGGATPAVVQLRLAQAAQQWKETP
ncbi:malonate decarboxylase acyl carrier protein [Polynucleobacter sp. IMCC 29146]|jgi:malonate decarboxylase delta subunit|uniref:malonate decarboxylase acyl carrier protein n=1 Tax=Polynucleobacter sp. IMCC 29146 TaxID=2780953 RepID=UPI001F39E85F|nr:malonate decarboxylase acyl carrier protein [Polynucleobacter sp. IMCC 29146]MCE7530025.1 malonate decarboxylase acyl carrier protein [Polynucleobacter sp. IMCC 29146]